MKKYAKVIPILVLVIIALAIALPRLGLPYVWDDTGTIIFAKTNTLTEMTNPAETLLHHLKYAWCDGPEVFRYFPINHLQVITLMTLFPDDTTIPITYQAIVWGLLAMMIYLLATELTGKRLIGIGSVLLFSLSIPGIQMSWILLQTTPLVELAIVSGLYCYVRYRRSGQSTWFYLLITLCVIAPLVRELAVLLPAVVLATTVAERRWDKKLLIALPALLIYSIFPSTVPSLFYGKFILSPIFLRGVPSLYTQMYTEGKIGIGFMGFYMPAHLVLYITPILTGLALLSIGLFLGNKLKRKIVGQLLIIVILTLSFVSLFFTGYNLQVTLYTVMLVLVVVMATEEKSNRLLPIWFLIAWIPFFWLYNGSDCGLAAPAIPWAIMVMLWIYRLPRAVENLLKPHAIAVRYTAQALLILLFAIGFIAQPLNLLATSGAYRGVASIDKETASNIPADSIVVTNLIHGAELKLLTNNKFEHYYAFYMPNFPPYVRDATAYDEMVSVESNNHDIYVIACLSVEDGENHWLINQPDKVLELKAEFEMRHNYPVIDPLKWLLPEHSRPYCGPPDLAPWAEVNTYPFHQETVIKYSMYKLIEYNSIAKGTR